MGRLFHHCPGSGYGVPYVGHSSHGAGGEAAAVHHGSVKLIASLVGKDGPFARVEEGRIFHHPDGALNGVEGRAAGAQHGGAAVDDGLHHSPVLGVSLRGHACAGDGPGAAMDHNCPWGTRFREQEINLHHSLYGAVREEVASRKEREAACTFIVILINYQQFLLVIAVHYLAQGKGSPVAVKTGNYDNSLLQCLRREPVIILKQLMEHGSLKGGGAVNPHPPAVEDGVISLAVQSLRQI